MQLLEGSKKALISAEIRAFYMAGWCLIKI
jgi:hypothetical protein